MTQTPYLQMLKNLQSKEPQVTEAATLPARTRKVQHQTTHVEFYTLCEWCKTADFSGAHTLSTASERASKAMSFAVSNHTIQNALRTVGITLPDPPVTPAIRKDGNVAILAREMVSLMRELGKDIPADLLAISQKRSPSAIKESQA